MDLLNLKKGERNILDCRGYTLDLSRKTHIMGILNVTPDSFSDGGEFLNPEEAVEHAMKMRDEGADIIDVGGESTRPGSDPISPQEELERVSPVLQILVDELDIPISIDTYKSEVASEALGIGVHMVNDISGLRFDAGMVAVIKEFNVPVVIMHIKGTPKNMQVNPVYEDLMGEIRDYLQEGAEMALSAGVQRNKIIIDPGMGFGKRIEDNFVILRDLNRLKSLGFPIVVGPSRKSFIGLTLNLPVHERIEGTAASVTAAILNGADIVRVHDVKQMSRVVKIADKIAGKN